MTTNSDKFPRQPDDREPLNEHAAGDELDLVDETVAKITDAEVEEQLRRVLDQSASVPERIWHDLQADRPLSVLDAHGTSADFTPEPRVFWSKRAETDLQVIVADPVVRAQLKENAGEILHDMPPVVFPHDEGCEGEVMWHRGITQKQKRQIDAGELPEIGDGPWNYFFFYRKPDVGQGFEVLAICSIQHIAEQWVKMNREAASSAEAIPASTWDTADEIEMAFAFASYASSLVA